jgi:hypothetical protein
MNAICAVKNLVLSFKGREMTYDQNMAIFNLIELILGSDAADLFSKSMDSSDDCHDSTTTYTYLVNPETIWINIIEVTFEG